MRPKKPIKFSIFTLQQLYEICQIVKEVRDKKKSRTNHVRVRWSKILPKPNSTLNNISISILGRFVGSLETNFPNLNLIDYIISNWEQIKKMNLSQETMLQTLAKFAEADGYFYESENNYIHNIPDDDSIVFVSNKKTKEKIFGLADIFELFRAINEQRTNLGHIDPIFWETYLREEFLDKYGIQKIKGFYGKYCHKYSKEMLLILENYFLQKIQNFHKLQIENSAPDINDIIEQVVQLIEEDPSITLPQQMYYKKGNKPTRKYHYKKRNKKPIIQKDSKNQNQEESKINQTILKENHRTSKREKNDGLNLEEIYLIHKTIYAQFQAGNQDISQIQWNKVPFRILKNYSISQIKGTIKCIFDMNNNLDPFAVVEYVVSNYQDLSNFNFGREKDVLMQVIQIGIDQGIIETVAQLKETEKDNTLEHFIVSEENEKGKNDYNDNSLCENIEIQSQPFWFSNKEKEFLLFLDDSNN